SKFQSFDQKGIAVIEFTLIVPVIITMYFGLASLSSAMMITRKINLISRAVADLVSQQPAGTNLTDATLDQISAAAQAIFYPNDPTNLKILVSEIIIYNQGGYKARTEFSVSIGPSAINQRYCGVLAPVANGSTFSVGSFPSGLYTLGAFVEAHVKYNWSPSFATNIAPAGGFTLQAVNYMRPRQSAHFSYIGYKPSTKCTGPY
ncbi:MAG: pilus assembly protein, partial [Alphaproteobacteria bacterium]|nr:pilus assembly protein [Alphaproteobacteria bacterium]